MINEDSERLRKTTIAFLKDFADKGYENAVECIDWLEKQGELVNSLSKELDNAHERIDGLIQKNNELCIKLENQCEQKPIDWSEEDERLFQIVIDILDRSNHFGNLSHADLIACVRKLKSLRLQNQ
jgi:hypothetical protein